MERAVVESQDPVRVERWLVAAPTQHRSRQNRRALGAQPAWSLSMALGVADLQAVLVADPKGSVDRSLVRLPIGHGVEQRAACLRPGSAAWRAPASRRNRSACLCRP